jgi:hypothetical protein
LHSKPADSSTHWSVRAIAAETAISATGAHRYFKLLEPPELALARAQIEMLNPTS